jgi:hypothetical protein
VKNEANEENSNSSIKKEELSESEDKPGSSGVTSGGFKFKKRFGKNPNVDTSFLPDKEREAEEDELR